MRLLKGSDMKDYNTFKVFECIRHSGPLTKKEIQDKTKLSWGSISNNTTSLLSAGLISEYKSQPGALGRTPSTYDICDTDNWCVGIDVAMDRILGYVTSLKCSPLLKVCDKLASTEAQSVVEQIFDVLHKLFESAGDYGKIKGIGLSLPGLVDMDLGEPVFIHHFTGPFPHNLVQIIEQEFNVPTWIFHDPECMLMTELKSLTNMEDYKNLLLIRWSYAGIGMSMILGGNLYRGANKTAGELGHITMDPNGPRCTCGKSGCLEVYASIRAIVKKVRFGVSMGLCPTLKDYEGNLEKIDFDVVRYGIDRKDSYVLNVIDEAIAYMGIAIANTVNIIDPQLIIIGGEISLVNPICFERLKKAIEARTWRKQPIEMKISTQFEGSAAIGAAEMMVNNIYYNVYDSKI